MWILSGKFYLACQSGVSSTRLESKRGKGAGSWELQPLKEAEILDVQWRQNLLRLSAPRCRTGEHCIFSGCEVMVDYSNLGVFQMKSEWVGKFRVYLPFWLRSWGAWALHRYPLPVVSNEEFQNFPLTHMWFFFFFGISSPFWLDSLRTSNHQYSNSHGNTKITDMRPSEETFSSFLEICDDQSNYQILPIKR